VKAIITGKDLPSAEDKVAKSGEGSVNYSYLRQNVLAQDKVLYHGHPVAAVAAVDIHTAEEALALIKVEYEPLPPVLGRPRGHARRRADPAARPAHPRAGRSGRR
jgi:xanthine dehydrogenase molybdenum-binding subunit